MSQGTLTKKPWRVRGVSVTGYRHLQDGVDCQDAWRREILPHGTVILAVADGAGSRARASEGSRIAVGLAIDVFSKLFADGAPAKAESCKSLMHKGFKTIHREFERTTSNMGGASRPDDFGTTLTVAVLAGDYVGMLRLGDGFIIVAVPRADGTGLHLVSYSESDHEFANQTDFLTSSNAKEAVQIDCMCEPELTFVLLSTDGLAPIALRGRKEGALRANASFLDRVVPHLTSPTGDPSNVARLLGESEKVTNATGDDMTLLVAVRP